MVAGRLVILLLCCLSHAYSWNQNRRLLFCRMTSLKAHSMQSLILLVSIRRHRADTLSEGGSEV